MAVVERRYRAYDGALVSRWRRWWVLPKYAYADAFSTRRFVVFFAACFLPTLGLLLLIFLHQNLEALRTMHPNLADPVPINAVLFHQVFRVQAMLAFAVALVVGPSLVASDLRHNALPLYLSRPISRGEYIGGKVLVVAVLMSLVTWVPDLVLMGVHALFAGAAWLAEHAWVARSLVVAGLSWALVVSVVTVALSAWLKWKPVASGALVALFVVPTAFGEMIYALFGTRWGLVISPSHNAEAISDVLFGRPTAAAPPTWAAWLAMALLLAAALFLLRWRVHAYEVVS